MRPLGASRPCIQRKASEDKVCSAKVIRQFMLAVALLRVPHDALLDRKKDTRGRVLADIMSSLCIALKIAVTLVEKDGVGCVLVTGSVRGIT